MPTKPPPAEGPLPRAWLVDDPRFDEHAVGGGGGYHPERPERLSAARRAALACRVSWDRLAAREASDEELARVHSPTYLQGLERLRGQSGYLDGDTYFAPHSVQAARLAAGTVVDLVDRVIESNIPRGLALVRPPGHHARPGRAMGFCLLNTIAVAAAHAYARGLTRVLIVDWDVHHGNGTQEMFWRSPNILYASTHQFPFYPGTGAAEELGEGDGAGFSVNVPLSQGGGDAVYRGAFERVLLPIFEEYKPELVLVSAGFDASKRDPLANMELTADCFGWMAAALRAVADGTANGRLVLVLEGGYDLVALEAGLVSAVHGAFVGETPDVPSSPGHPDVERAVSTAAPVWRGVR